MKKVILTILVAGLVSIHALGGLVTTFTLHTVSKSYYAKTEAGNLIPITVNGKKYYQVSGTEVVTARSFNPWQTTLIIMDPWADSGSPQLNAHYAPTLTNGIVPLVQKAIALGFRNVIVMTNRAQPFGYGVAIDPRLQQLVAARKISLLYHEDWNASNLTSTLKAQNITSIVYAGFASSMCVINRPTGLIAMGGRGFKLYFVPEASAAIEFDDWMSTPGPVHAATTQLISQWMADLIDLQELLKL